MKSNGRAYRFSGLFFLLALGIALALGGPGGAWAKGKPPPRDDPPPEPVEWGEPAIVFTVLNLESRGIGVADLNGNYKVLVDLIGIDVRSPTWLPDGSGFLFYSDRFGPGIHFASFSYAEDGNGQIDEASIQLGPIQLVHPTNNAFGLANPLASPIWSSGACTAPLNGTCKIFQVVFADRPSVEAPTNYVYMARMEIPLSGGAPVMDMPTQLTPPPENTVSWPDDAYASWSNDGMQVVTKSRLSYGPDGCQEVCPDTDDIVVIEDLNNPFGSRLSLIQAIADTTIGRFPSHPRWANTSNLIYLDATTYYPGTTRQEDGGAFDVWTLNLNGTPDNITYNEDYTQDMPTVSPDDLQIVYRRSGSSRDCGDKGRGQSPILEIRSVSDGSLCGGTTLVQFPADYPWPNRPHWFVKGKWVDSTDPIAWPY